MLLIDGVKYQLWEPKSEDEFEQVVKEHTHEIFGEQSIYLDKKQKLKSLSGIGSIPDGYAILFGNQPEWHIVEIELSTHPLHEHIVAQISKFIAGTDSLSTKNSIVKIIYNSITDEDKLRLKKAIETVEIYKFLSDLISKPPILTVIIEKSPERATEVLKQFANYQTKVIEFQTFTREEVGLAVHAHLFKPVIPTKPPDKLDTDAPPPIPPKNELYQQFFSELTKRYSSLYPSRTKLKAQPLSWLSFGGGKTGFYFGWAFRSDRRFSVELYIDVGDKDKNKDYFDRIKKSEAQIGLENISWERLDEKQASRIAIYTSGDIVEIFNSAWDNQRLMQWAIETMKNFSDKLSSVIKSL